MKKQTSPKVQREARETSRATAPAGDGSILVLDDDQIVRILATGMIEHLGFAATACSTGEEAVALYRKAKDAGKPFMAAILDLEVDHGMGGDDAAREMVAMEPEAYIITSGGGAGDRGVVDFRCYGFCCVMHKRYHLSDISKVLSHLANLLKVTKPQTRR